MFRPLLLHCQGSHRYGGEVSSVSHFDFCFYECPIQGCTAYCHNCQCEPTLASVTMGTLTSQPSRHTFLELYDWLRRRVVVVKWPQREQTSNSAMFNTSRSQCVIFFSAYWLRKKSFCAMLYLRLFARRFCYFPWQMKGRLLVNCLQSIAINTTINAYHNPSEMLPDCMSLTS